MYKCHLFICTNGGDTPGKCAQKNSEDLHRKVKQHFRSTGRKDIRINKSGCLDACEKGIAAVLYPQNQWFLELSANDDQKLIDSIEKIDGPQKR